jgi:two-component system response regulator DevR
MATLALALIVASPGPLREGLRAALSAIPSLDEVSEVEDTAAAVSRFAGRTPALVLVSTGLDGSNAPENCRQIKSCWPDAPCLMLVDTVGLGPVAKAAGADLVLVKGVRPEKLLARIETLLREEDLTDP